MKTKGILMMLSLFLIGLGEAKGKNTEDYSDSAVDEKVSVVIPPAQVNDVVNNSYFGGYVADILMERMLQCDKVRVLDRSVLDAQIDEMSLAGDVIDPATTIERGKVIGARYLLQTTMQKPDIRNAKNGVAVALGMGTTEELTIVNAGTHAYIPYGQTAHLKAAVSISAKVVDLQTGEVVFMCTGNGNARGKTDMSLEYNAWGGGRISSGTEGFKQTVTGKAILQAVAEITPPLEDFFNGRMDRKVVGTLSGNYLNSGEKMYNSGYKLYLGTQKLEKDEIASVFRNQPDLYFKYRKALKQRRVGRALGYTGIVAAGAGAFITGVSASEHLPGFAIIGGVIGGAGLYCSAIHWPIKHNAGKKMLNEIVNSYNLQNTGQSYIKQHNTPAYTLAFSPTGVCFTF